MTNPPSFLFRSLTSFIFVYAGMKHVLQPEAILKKVSTSTAFALVHNQAVFQAAILLSGMVMLAGGLALLLGVQVKKAATVLLAVLIPITLSVQLENLNDLGPFFKNVAISGSLLFILKSKKHEEQITPVPATYNDDRLVVTSANHGAAKKGQPSVPAAANGTHQSGH